MLERALFRKWVKSWKAQIIEVTRMRGIYAKTIFKNSKNYTEII